MPRLVLSDAFRPLLPSRMTSAVIPRTNARIRLSSEQNEIDLRSFSLEVQYSTSCAPGSKVDDTNHVSCLSIGPSIYIAGSAERGAIFNMKKWPRQRKGENIVSSGGTFQIQVAPGFGTLQTDAICILFDDSATFSFSRTSTSEVLHPSKSQTPCS
jgi:hypothetical protein